MIYRGAGPMGPYQPPPVQMVTPTLDTSLDVAPRPSWGTNSEAELPQTVLGVGQPSLDGLARPGPTILNPCLWIPTTDPTRFGARKRLSAVTWHPQKSHKRILKRRKYSTQNRARPDSSRASSYANPNLWGKPLTAQNFTLPRVSRHCHWISYRTTSKLIFSLSSFSLSSADFFGFFFHAIPEEHGNVLTLPELHELVADVWLTRHDAELEKERTARRKGRPKSTNERKLEEVKLREAEEYRTGIGEKRLFLLFGATTVADVTLESEVPDLTHPENVALYRTWDQREVAFIQLLRFIRISSTKLDTAIVSKPGRHPSLATQQIVSIPMDVEAVT